MQVENLHAAAMRASWVLVMLAPVFPRPCSPLHCAVGISARLQESQKEPGAKKIVIRVVIQTNTTTKIPLHIVAKQEGLATG